jgi:adenosylcobinamide-GDP ribazoletransferase
VPHSPLSDTDVARSAGFFAWVGLGLGGLLWLAERGLAPLGEPLVSLALVGLWAWITGALHLDGLADTVDGLSGGRGDPERTLAIMRDSRIGAHGATALVVMLGLKAAALMRGRELAGDLVWLVPALARFGCTLLLACFVYARSHGLGSAFAGRVGAREVLIGGVALGVTPLLWTGLGWRELAAALVGLAASFGLALRMRRTLGGLTGDVHGAAIELAELSMLLGLVAFHLR